MIERELNFVIWFLIFSDNHCMTQTGWTLEFFLLFSIIYGGTVYKYSIISKQYCLLPVTMKWVCFVQEVKTSLGIGGLRHYYKHLIPDKYIVRTQLRDLSGRLLLEMQTATHPRVTFSDCSGSPSVRNKHNCIYNVTGMVDGHLLRKNHRLQLHWIALPLLANIIVDYGSKPHVS